MMTGKQRAFPWALLALITQASGFYIPGLAPVSYKKGQEVPLTVNVLSPLVNRTQKLKSILTYDYYDPKLHFCQPEKITKLDENLGAMLFGDRIQNSAFTVLFLFHSYG